MRLPGTLGGVPVQFRYVHTAGTSLKWLMFAQGRKLQIQVCNFWPWANINYLSDVPAVYTYLNCTGTPPKVPGSLTKNILALSQKLMELRHFFHALPSLRAQT